MFRDGGRAGRRPVPIGVDLGLAGHVGLLTVLAGVGVIGVTGWVAGAIVGLVVWGLLTRELTLSGARRLGPANVVTLTRAGLVSGVVGLAAESVAGRAAHPLPVPLVVAMAGVALVLDALDGQVARRTGTATALGARFDMEVDALLILALSVLLLHPVGAWVLAIGGMRYVFVGAGRLLPWLLAPLPPRYSRKVVAAVQGVVLVVAVSGVLPATLTRVVLAAALVALTWSFGRDVGWLARSAERRQEPVPEAVHAPDRRVRSRV